MNNIFVYIEIEDGAIADVSLELLTKGRELASKLGVKLDSRRRFYVRTILTVYDS